MVLVAPSEARSETQGPEANEALMIDLPWWSCILIFGVAAALTVVCTPVALRLAKRLDYFDTPTAGKSQQAPVPYLGGLAIVVPFVLIAVVAGLVGTSDQNDVGYLAVFLAMAVGLAALGLVDDLRGLSPWPRLLLEIGAGIGVWKITDAAWIPGPRPLQAVVTVCWVVIVTNSFNLLDNMDGLAAGIAAVSSIFLFAVALENGQFLLATFALALAGCATGFLRYNFRPARIYMGDTGSLFLGFIFAVLSLDLRFPTAQPAMFVVPVLIVGVALFDTTLVSIMRPLQGRTPLQGGLDHVSHRLVFVGLSVRAAVCLLYSVALALGSIALVITNVDWTTRLIVGGLVALFALATGFVLARVPVYREAGASRAPAPEAPTRVQADHTGRFDLSGNSNGHRAPLGDAPAFGGPRRWNVIGRSRESRVE
jgi:UDP-GlcNAc:undecaprenyl-phosphate/decaprenyl-phosphate GlcNAc-1-phosphate transferase